MERTLAFLSRATTHAVDEPRLRHQIGISLRKTFYAVGGEPLDVVAARGHLAELLLEKVHQPIDRNAILQALNAHGIRLREWALEKTVSDGFVSRPVTVRLGRKALAR